MNKNPLTVIPAKAGILKIPHQVRDDKSDFQCIHCGKKITTQQSIGTLHRNHCPYCLWSKHVDGLTPGDRISTCQSAMEPIGLTFKQEGMDKYGKQKQGEIMIIHRCTTCEKININRIAGDDDAIKAQSLLDTSNVSTDILTKIQEQKIRILNNEDVQEVRKQLLGINPA